MLAVELDGAGVGLVGAVEQPGQLGAAGSEQAGEADDLAACGSRSRSARSRPCVRAPSRRAAARRCGRRGAGGARRRSSGAATSSLPIILEMSSVRSSSAVRYSPTYRPLRRTVMRSLIAYTWSRKCETNRIATPWSRSRRMTANSCSTSVASRLDVGSSRMSTLESVTIARLIATSCCIASESDDSGSRVSRCSRPSLASASLGAAVGRLPLDAEPAADLVAEHHVLADREVRAEVDLLVHDRDAGRLGVGGAVQPALLAVDHDLRRRRSA